MPLADVAHEGLPSLRQGRVGRPGAHHLERLPMEPREQGVDAVRIEGDEAHAQTHHLLEGDGGAQEPDGRSDSRVRRDHHAADAELAGETAGVERGRAAEGDEGVGRRVEPLLHRVAAGGVRHRLVHHLGDADGGVLRVGGEGIADVSRRSAPARSTER